ncbi:MAG: 2Fe-2S iron-sulfur cluster-binding protein [SAR324 cluster bacterium]|nr:2Fe-2S iron-sulfur cluster-binding protein [SAR324 cluster bacterium]
MTEKQSGQKLISLTIYGKTVRVHEGTTIWEAAREAGIDIPVLCHSPRMEPVGVCRICVVEIGERVLAASCVRMCEEGMQVQADSDDIQQHRKMLTALLLSDYPQQSAREESTGDDELLALARDYGITELTFPDGAAGPEGRGTDGSSPVIAVDHQACILCDRCIRACDDIQHNDVIGRTGKGYQARIAFDLNTPMGESSCVACGECMAVCPTGALTNKSVAGLKIVVT